MQIHTFPAVRDLTLRLQRFFVRAGHDGTGRHSDAAVMYCTLAATCRAKEGETAQMEAMRPILLVTFNRVMGW